MKKFTYEARDQATNKIVKSSIQADTETAAARLLIKQGFVPLNVKEQVGEGGLTEGFGAVEVNTGTGSKAGDDALKCTFGGPRWVIEGLMTHKDRQA